MKEIALIGDSVFLTAVQTLGVNKNMVAQGKTFLTDINNF